jgi:hypothetical protein
MQKFLPRMRPHGVAKERPIGPPFEAIGFTILLVGPTGGEIPERLDLVVCDGAIADRGPDNLIASPSERCKQHLEVLGFDDDVISHLQRGLLH